jgi:hypothetical protein
MSGCIVLRHQGQVKKSTSRLAHHHSHMNLTSICASPRARGDILNFIGDPERR